MPLKHARTVNIFSKFVARNVIEIAHQYGSNLHPKFVIPVFLGHEPGSKIGRIPKLQGPLKLRDS